MLFSLRYTILIAVITLLHLHILLKQNIWLKQFFLIDTDLTLGNYTHISLLHWYNVNKCFYLFLIADVDFRSNPTFEPICKAQEEHFIESDGKESSLILEFNNAILLPKTTLSLPPKDEQAFVQTPQPHLHPPTYKHQKPKSCTRILSAPPNYGFIIRLILPKIRHSNYHHSSVLGASLTSAPHAGTSDVHDKEPMDLKANINKLQMLNTDEDLKKALGRSCPLSIVSICLA